MRHIRALGAALILAVTLAVIGHTPVAAEPNEAVGPSKPAAAALSAGAYTTCVVGNDGSARCWGANGGGQLGQGDTGPRGNQPDQLGDTLPAIDLGTGRTARAVTIGGSHACALLDNGTVKCWGFSTNGQLGQGTTSTRGSGPGQLGDNLPALGLGTGRTATTIAAGGNHTCAVLDNNTVKCWGQGFFGQLGYGDTVNRGDDPNELGDDLPAINLGTGRTATAITAGGLHTCALLDNGTVKCWGNNFSGELGHGNTSNQANEDGDILPTVNLGTGRTATAITAGGNHTCAVLDNSTVKCWGDNTYGQLGQGDTNNRGDNANELGDSLPAINLGTGRTAQAVAAGGFHTCALLDDNTTKCWGNNQASELGHGTADDVVGDQPTDMGNNLPVTNLGTGRTAVAVTAGDDHTCALRDNATVTCWGAGFYGQTGRGTGENSGGSTADMGDNLTAVNLTVATGPSAARATVTATPTTVNVGDTVTYSATIRNVGGSDLTGLTVTSAAAPNCNRTLPTLPIAATTTFTCTDIAAAGDVPRLTNQLTIANDQNVTLTPSAAVTVTAPVMRSVNVTFNATPAQVIVGEAITYVGTITNTGNVALDNVVYSAINDELPGNVSGCSGTRTQLPVNGSINVRCEYTTSRADRSPVSRTLTVSATGVPSQRVTSTVTVGAVRQRVDTLIRPDGGRFIGDNIYGPVSGQTLRDKFARGQTSTFTWRVQNDGNSRQQFTLDAITTNRKFPATYTINKKNVTAAVTTNTYRVTLNPGQSIDITVDITYPRQPPGGAEPLFNLAANGKGTRDAVRIRVTGT